MNSFVNLAFWPFVTLSILGLLAKAWPPIEFTTEEEASYQEFVEQVVEFERVDYPLYRQIAEQSRNELAELALVRQVFFRANPDLFDFLGDYHNLDFVRQLNATIYWSIPQIPSPPDSPWYDFDHFVLDSMSGGLDRGRGHICGGLSMNLATGLAAFGIQHRAVGMFSSLEDYDAHVSVEVLMDDRWVVIDPTFNAVFVDETGRLLSWHEIRERCDAGLTVEPVYTDDMYRTGNGTEDYYTSICNLTRFVVFSPSLRTPAETLPIDWDGHVIQLGQPYSVVNDFTYNRIYTLAAMDHLYCRSCTVAPAAVRGGETGAK